MEKLEKWKEEAGEIPAQTCPDIDKLIKEHNLIIEQLDYLDRNQDRYENVKDFAKDLPSTWSSNVEDIAEQLRKDNAQLRELGQFWYEKTKEVAEDLENLKDWIRIHGYE